MWIKKHGFEDGFILTGGNYVGLMSPFLFLQLKLNKYKIRILIICNIIDVHIIAMHLWVSERKAHKKNIHQFPLNLNINGSRKAKGGMKG